MPVTEDALYNIIQDTWNSTLGFAVNRSELAVREGAGELAVRASVAGAWNGEVCLRCPEPLARLIAGAFFQIDPSKAGQDQVLDALSELVHIVGGNLKGLLPQPITLSLPSLEDAVQSAGAVPNQPVVCRLSLASSGYPFTISLIGGFPKDGIERVADREKLRVHADNP